MFLCKTSHKTDPTVLQRQNISFHTHRWDYIRQIFISSAGWWWFNGSPVKFDHRRIFCLFWSYSSERYVKSISPPGPVSRTERNRNTWWCSQADPQEWREISFLTSDVMKSSLSSAPEAPGVYSSRRSGPAASADHFRFVLTGRKSSSRNHILCIKVKMLREFTGVRLLLLQQISDYLTDLWMHTPKGGVSFICKMCHWRHEERCQMEEIDSRSADSRWQTDCRSAQSDWCNSL